MIETALYKAVFLSSCRQSIRLNSFVSLITIFLGECLFLFVLRYVGNKEGIYLKITKLDNHNPFITCTKRNE
ncbi:hypothetical protein CN424_27445 [Bacillus cereus]|nr:hypothetical protein CN424_27445 [Bacillus cereus]